MSYHEIEQGRNEKVRYYTNQICIKLESVIFCPVFKWVFKISQKIEMLGIPINWESINSYPIRPR